MLSVIILMVIADIAHQTDWMGGLGVLGPVPNWGTQFWESESVTVATPGQVSLVATGWNYSNWVKHIVENISGINTHAQGLMPVDIDNDGILDLVAHTADQVVWYKHDGFYNFSKNVIGTADDGGVDAACVYPCDIDQDGDIDVLVATGGVGLGWYENQGVSWLWHSIDNSIGYHRVSAADVELDGALDIIAADNTHDQHHGDIYLFRNNGSQSFTKELVFDFTDCNGWRVYLSDFNNDGFPDIHSVGNNTYFFLNDQSGSFILSWWANFWAPNGLDFDGAWPSDIDMDGDMDLVCGRLAGPIYGFYGLLNDGTGSNFDTLFLDGTATNSYLYEDGSITRDIDSDGMFDIAGALHRVGWFRQAPMNPLTFDLWDMDTVSNGTTHWVYASPICSKCIPSIDLLVTHTGAHIVYENNMLLEFASIGQLESSILELTPPNLEPCTLKFFGYNACVPYDTSLSFYWRVGLDSTGIDTSSWNGPMNASVGINVVDSFFIGSGIGRMFQYKAEFKGASDDIAVLYEVWITYQCSPLFVEEMSAGGNRGISLQFTSGKLLLHLPYEDQVRFTIYDIAGRLARNVFDGRLSSGVHEFEIPEKPGVYFVRVQYTGGVRSLKFTKLK